MFEQKSGFLIKQQFFLSLCKMTTSIKQKLHDLIDQIENESILRQVYDLIYRQKASMVGDLWKGLTPEQQTEVLASLEESNDPKNLIS